MTKIWHFKGILQSTGWAENSYISTNASGRITSIDSTIPTSASKVETVNGWIMPGFQNAHSHSFQYAMSGLAEIHSNPTSSDDFWSWRNTMYHIALSMNPDQFQAIATMLYSEILSHGYTHVAEFHYVHHSQNGTPYDNLSEMGERLIAAAQQVGIGITLVPIFYQKGGFGKIPSNTQRRFISQTADEYLNLLMASWSSSTNYSKANMGIGIHSLRAVDQFSMAKTLQEADDMPIHIHISEQLKEIEDCLSFHGQRPVEWLYNHHEVDAQYNLVHATHLDEMEVSQIAKSGANVVLCPSTEGNLGDGIFPLASFQNQGGVWSIGTDSNIGLNPLEELRILDYGQRLTTHKRNQFISLKNGDSGRFAIDMTLRTGRKAMGNTSTAYFKIGDPLDAIVLDGTHPLLVASEAKNLLSTLVYSCDRAVFKGTITDGTWKVQNGKHHLHEKTINNFVSALNELKIR